MCKGTNEGKTNSAAGGQNELLVMRFCDLAKGTRFKYPDGSSVWVVIEAYGDGLIVEWTGVEANRMQSHCCFVDDDWSLESEVEVIC